METPGATSRAPQGPGKGPRKGPGKGWDAAREWPARWHVEVVAQTGSTNADLLAAARRGAPNRSVLVTAHQTAGRGRLDRRWDAPPGDNLLVSVLFRSTPRPLPTHLHELTQRVALAAASAARSVAGVDAQLKWPNDLLVGDAKLAGVLAQTGTPPATAGGRVDHVVVGLGLNVGWAPEGGARLGDGVHPLDVLRAMLVAFDDLPHDVHPVYRANLGTLGRQVRVELPSGEVRGRVVDVGRDGRLAVLDGCAITHHVDSGDVIHLRPI